MSFARTPLWTYKTDGGAPKDFVRVCGVRRFQRGLAEIERNISAHGIRADFWTWEVDRLEAMEQDEEVVGEICANRRNLDDEKKAIKQPEALYEEVTKQWSNIELHRDIGYAQHAEAIKVDVARYLFYIHVIQCSVNLTKTTKFGSVRFEFTEMGHAHCYKNECIWASDM